MQEAVLVAEEYEAYEALQSTVNETHALEAALEQSIVDRLQTLPTCTYIEAVGTKKEEEECPLCFEVFSPEDEVRLLLCKHCFHRECIDRWLLEAQAGKHRTCPLCSGCPI